MYPEKDQPNDDVVIVIDSENKKDKVVSPEKVKVDSEKQTDEGKTVATTDDSEKQTDEGKTVATTDDSEKQTDEGKTVATTDDSEKQTDEGKTVATTDDSEKEKRRTWR